MTQPATAADARGRALRTLAQQLVIDVALAVLVVVIPLASGDHPDWGLVVASACKTALSTALAFAHRTLERYRTPSL